MNWGKKTSHTAWCLTCGNPLICSPGCLSLVQDWNENGEVTIQYCLNEYAAVDASSNSGLPITHWVYFQHSTSLPGQDQTLLYYRNRPVKFALHHTLTLSQHTRSLCDQEGHSDHRGPLTSPPPLCPEGTKSHWPTGNLLFYLPWPSCTDWNEHCTFQRSPTSCSF